MRTVFLGFPPSDEKAQLRWLVSAVQEIARASQEHDPNKAADGFTLSNLTESRAMDCDTVTTAQLADVVGTYLQDLKRRGQKQSETG